MPVFKAYDLRGRYPDEIDEAFAERLGGAIVRFLKAKRIAVGRDVRLSAPAIAAALARGAGCEFVDIGMCTTPSLSSRWAISASTAASWSPPPTTPRRTSA